MTVLFAMTTAQVIFSIGLGVATLAILAFAAFVVSTTMWGNRWVRAGAKGDNSRGETQPVESTRGKDQG